VHTTHAAAGGTLKVLFTKLNPTGTPPAREGGTYTYTRVAVFGGVYHSVRPVVQKTRLGNRRGLGSLSGGAGKMKREIERD